MIKQYNEVINPYIRQTHNDAFNVLATTWLTISMTEFFFVYAPITMRATITSLTYSSFNQSV